MAKIDYNLQDAVNPQDPQENEIVNANIMMHIKSVVNENVDDFGATLIGSILTDGFTISNNTKQRTFYYFGSADISVVLASTIPDLAVMEFVNLGTGSVGFNRSLLRVPGNVLPGTSNGRSTGRIIKNGSNWYGVGDFVTSATTLPALQSAVVLSDRTDVLLLNFSGTCSASIMKKAFTIDGLYRPISFVQGSGATIEIKLSDHVIPNTDISICYRREYGNLSSPAGKLLSFKQAVNISDVSAYNGTGTVYYVADDGNNTNNGLTPGAPKATFAHVAGLLGPGDYALFKKGDSWTMSEFNTNGMNGTASNYITFGTYGSGAKPILNNSGSSEVLDIRSNYMHVYGFQMPDRPSGQMGVRLVGSCIDTHLVGIDVTAASGNTQAFGIKVEGGHVRTQVLFCSADGFNETFIMEGGSNDPGFIAFNKWSGGNTDCCRCINPVQYNGVVFAFNEVTDWRQDGVDFFNASGVIFEYNEVHTPRSVGIAGNGIKYGGTSSSGNIVRYNYVHDIYQTAAPGENTNCFGITSNGCINGQVYGNLVVRTQGRGIDIGAGHNNQRIHHNTCIDVQVGIGCGGATGIVAYNNILQARGRTIDGGSGTITGGNNILIGQATLAYSGSNDDTNSSLTALFINAAARNFLLKSGSPAINGGRSIAGFSYTSDRRGTAISGAADIGCYEYDAAA